MPYIENLSLSNIVKGIHMNRPNDSILIQIVTPGDDFPKPWYDFSEVYQFEISDLVNKEFFDKDSNFTEKHASQIVKILIDAYNNNKNVVVHCAAGLSRSGAVACVGRMLGFELRYNNQIPNLNMLKMMEQVVFENHIEHVYKVRESKYK